MTGSWVCRHFNMAKVKFSGESTCTCEKWIYIGKLENAWIFINAFLVFNMYSFVGHSKITILRQVFKKCSIKMNLKNKK